MTQNSELTTTYKNHIMLDLETLATSPNAAIVAIGAVRFNIDAVTAHFYEVVNLESCFGVGLEVDADTLRWWMKKDDKARQVFDFEGRPLLHVLSMFKVWLGKDPIIWGNGADFDNAILRNAFRKCGLDEPWDKRNNRCYRTMWTRYPEIEWEHTGTKHNALDDAEAQAEHLIKIFEHQARLNLQLATRNP